MNNENVVVWNETLQDYIAYGNCQITEIDKETWILKRPVNNKNE